MNVSRYNSHPVCWFAISFVQDKKTALGPTLPFNKLYQTQNWIWMHTLLVGTLSAEVSLFYLFQVNDLGFVQSAKVVLFPLYLLRSPFCVRFFSLSLRSCLASLSFSRCILSCSFFFCASSLAWSRCCLRRFKTSSTLVFLNRAGADSEGNSS